MPPRRVAGNTTVTYNATAITAFLDQASLEAVTNAISVTNLASTAEQQIAGLPKFSAPVGGPWSKQVDDVLGPDALTPPSTLRALVLVVGPSGNQVTYTWASPTETYGAFVENYKIDGSSPTDGLKWSGNFAISGKPVRS
jgi:hypothetical protein